ncbi:MAG: ribonuclease HII [Candidatus Paceibacterota bacterium]
MKEKYIVGIDEVGRGPIAGPVAVCAFVCQTKNYELLIARGVEHTGVSVRDSKKLTKIQREKWFAFLHSEKQKGNCDFSVSYVSASMIDSFGIVPAIKKALSTSLSKVVSDQTETLIYLDGGLKADEKYANQETFIKGDELHPVISFASIVAKVSRDRVMCSHAKEYPVYGFDSHAGYGTKAHYEAIKNHGLTPLHRKTFIS